MNKQKQRNKETNKHKHIYFFSCIHLLPFISSKDSSHPSECLHAADSGVWTAQWVFSFRSFRYRFSFYIVRYSLNRLRVVSVFDRMLQFRVWFDFVSPKSFGFTLGFRCHFAPQWTTHVTDVWQNGYQLSCPAPVTGDELIKRRVWASTDINELL